MHTHTLCPTEREKKLLFVIVNVLRELYNLFFLSNVYLFGYARCLHFILIFIYVRARTQAHTRERCSAFQYTVM